MKYKLFTIVTIMMFIFISCKNGKDNNEDNKSTNQSTQTNSLDAEELVTAEDAEYKSVIFIDEKDARSLAKSYNRIIRSRALGTEDRASAVWFDEEVIKMLYEALYVGPEKDRLDGVRIYYGRYPKNYHEQSRAKKLTMFLLLTVPGRYEKTHNDTFYFKKPERWDIVNNEVHKKSVNHGELCPDVCDSLYNLRNDY